VLIFQFVGRQPQDAGVTTFPVLMSEQVFALRLSVR
jgi:hypothetical protein